MVLNSFKDENQYSKIKKKGHIIRIRSTSGNKNPNLRFLLRSTISSNQNLKEKNPKKNDEKKIQQNSRRNSKLEK